jgi:hypothetical protein
MPEGSGVELAGGAALDEHAVEVRRTMRRAGGNFTRM